MAVVYQGADGFESGTQRVPASMLSGTSVTNSQKNTGSYGLRISYQEYVRYPISGTPDNGAVSLFYYPSSTWSTYDGLRLTFVLTSGKKVGVYWDRTNKTFDAYVDGVKVADGSYAASSNAFFSVQLYVVIDGAAGSIEAKISGVTAVTFNGNTLPAASTADIEYVEVYAEAFPFAYAYVDDIVYGTGGFLGACNVERIYPDGDSSVQFSRSAGAANYENVDEVPASDADYVYTSTDAQADEYTLSDYDGTNKEIVLVGAYARAKLDAAVGDSVDVGVDSNGTDDVSNTVLETSYLYAFHWMENNPDDSLPWEEADIDALKLRVVSNIA